MADDDESKKCLAMKTGILLLSVALAALANPAQAQVTVNWNALENGLGTSAGVDLPIGSLVRIGSFIDLTDEQIQANQFDRDLLNDSFREFGATAIGKGTEDGENPSGYPAHWNESTSDLTDLLGLTGRQIYIWAFDAPSVGAATQHGIFTSSDSSWVFPSSSGSPPPPPTNINLEQVGLPAGIIVLGDFGIGTSDATGQALFNLTAIPEPSAYAAVFGVIGVGCAVWLRRSKSRPNLAGGNSR